MLIQIFYLLGKIETVLGSIFIIVAPRGSSRTANSIERRDTVRGFVVDSMGRHDSVGGRGLTAGHA